MTSQNDDVLLNAFNQSQQANVLSILKQNIDGLSLDQLMIEARLSEQSVLKFLENLNIGQINGVYKIPHQ